MRFWIQILQRLLLGLCLAGMFASCKNLFHLPETETVDRELPGAELDDPTEAPPEEEQQKEKIHIPVAEGDEIVPDASKSSVSTTEGATIASDVVGAYLAIPEGVEAAGPSTHVTVEQQLSFSEILALRVTIALDDALGLLQAAEDPHLVVLYQVVGADGETVYGVIPQSELEFSEDGVTFNLRGEGNYQAAVLPELVETEVVSDPVMTPILSEESASALPPLVWGALGGVFNNGARTVALSASHTPLELTLNNCIAVLDEDQTAPYDHRATTGPNTNHNFTITEITAHNLFGFFECFDQHGRVHRSPWSGGIAVTAIPPPSFAGPVDPVDGISGEAIAIAVAASGVDTYGLDTSAMDCDTVGGWSPALTIDPGSGLITGTPMTVGDRCTVKVTASNAVGIASQSIVITIWENPGTVCDTDTLGTCTINSAKVLPDLSHFQYDGDVEVAAGGSLSTATDESAMITVTGTFSVANGGSVLANLLDLTASAIVVEAGGQIAADGLSTYSGQVAGSLYDDSPTGQGGSHGGSGGADTGAFTANAYGLAQQPLTNGAQGEEGSSSAAGGLGGGVIRLTANSVTVDGTITAGGLKGAAGIPFGAGGGSGGSIWIATGTLTGGGDIKAIGGDGGDAAVGSNGGGGAGGRVALYTDANSGPAVAVGGGSSGSGGGSPAGVGASGTVHTALWAQQPTTLLFNLAQPVAGNLGGLIGADAYCQAGAAKAGLSGRWYSVLANSEVSAADRHIITGGLVDRDHTIIADSAADFWAGDWSNPVDVTQFSGVAASANYWTGMAIGGAGTVDHCDNWTDGSNLSNGVEGDFTMANGDALSATNSATCDLTRSLLCLGR